MRHEKGGSKTDQDEENRKEFERMRIKLSKTEEELAKANHQVDVKTHEISLLEAEKELLSAELKKEVVESSKLREKAQLYEQQFSQLQQSTDLQSSASSTSSSSSSSSWIFSVPESAKEDIYYVGQQLGFENPSVVFMNEKEFIDKPQLLIETLKKLTGKSTEGDANAARDINADYWKECFELLKEISKGDYFIVINVVGDENKFIKSFVSVIYSAYSAIADPGRILVALQGWKKSEIGVENPLGLSDSPSQFPVPQLFEKE